MGLSRTQQKQETRKKLLKVAFDEFSSKGILVAKTLDIARAAKVSHGAVFSHFPTRDALLLAVIDEFGMQLGSELQTRMKKATIEEVLSTHLFVLQEWEPFYRELVIASPLLPESVRASVVNIQSGIAFFLEKALANEKLVEKAPLHLLINTWLGLIHYYLVNKDLFCPKGSLIAAKGKELIEFFIRLIKGEVR